MFQCYSFPLWICGIENIGGSKLEPLIRVWFNRCISQWHFFEQTYDIFNLYSSLNDRDVHVSDDLGIHDTLWDRACESLHMSHSLHCMSHLLWVISYCSYNSNNFNSHFYVKRLVISNSWKFRVITTSWSTSYSKIENSKIPMVLE